MMMGLGGGRVIWETTVWPERLNRKKSLSDNLTFKPGPMSPQHFTALPNAIAHLVSYNLY